MRQDKDRPPSTTPQYLLAGLILGMAIAAAFLISRVPAFFGPEGGDPVLAGLSAAVFVVLAVAAFIVRPAALGDRATERGPDGDEEPPSR